MKYLTYSSFTLLVVLFCSTAFSQSFTSTNKPIQLIELYTSEGCSSCPPADIWINKLKQHPKLWSEFIPVVFHVDYWDYIGWKDPFANKQFSNRQRQYASKANLSSVYTPGMLFNGKEWTSWRKQSRLTIPYSSATTGQLSVIIEDGILTANYHAKKSQQSALILNIAILGFDMKSVVNAGENNGHTFTHDFVVLGFKRISMKQTETNTYIGLLDQLPSLSEHSDKLAISAWINANGNLAPLQAIGGFIKRP